MSLNSLCVCSSFLLREMWIERDEVEERREELEDAKFVFFFDFGWQTTNLNQRQMEKNNAKEKRESPRNRKVGRLTCTSSKGVAGLMDSHCNVEIGSAITRHNPAFKFDKKLSIQNLPFIHTVLSLFSLVYPHPSAVVRPHSPQSAFIVPLSLSPPISSSFPFLITHSIQLSDLRFSHSHSLLLSLSSNYYRHHAQIQPDIQATSNSVTLSMGSGGCK